MSVTLYGKPGEQYVPLGSGGGYVADSTGRIDDVRDQDKGDLLRMGCIDETSWAQARIGVGLNGQPASPYLMWEGAPTSGIAGTYAGFAPPGTLLVTDLPALYQNYGTTEAPLWSVVGGPAGFALIGRLLAADMNSTNDQLFELMPSPSGQFRVRLITVTNASRTLDTAVGGIYTASGKGGTAIVANSQAYSALTDPTTAFDLAVVMTPGNTFWLDGTPLFLSLDTAQGVAALADFYVYGAN